MGQARKSLWIEVLLAQRDVDSGDKRSADEICQQELKNAVCITLKEKGAQEKCDPDDGVCPKQYFLSGGC